MKFDVHATTNYSEIKKLQKGQHESLSDFMNAYRPVVYRWYLGFKFSNGGKLSKHDAEMFSWEFCADLFTEDKITKFKIGKARFRNWLKEVALNNLIDKLRKLGREPTSRGGTDFSSLLKQIPTAEPYEDGLAWKKQDTYVLYSAIRAKLGIKDPHWRSFWGFYMEGLSTAELSEELQLNENYVKQLRYRVRQNLMRELRHLGCEDLMPDTGE